MARNEAFDEFCRRHQCAHTDTEDLMLQLYDAEAELRELRAVVASQQEGLGVTARARGCYYDDNCPPPLDVHDRCPPCVARAALTPPTSESGNE